MLMGTCEGSDLDIPVAIMGSDLSCHKRSVPIYRDLAGLLIPKDVLVYTTQEIEAWKDVPQAFSTSVLKKGRVIYEKWLILSEEGLKSLC